MATEQALDWVSVQKDVQERLKQKPADDVKKKIAIPDPVPAGNHLAHFIRSIHWNSKGMLPSTAGSQRTYDKYNTVTNLSFQKPAEDWKGVAQAPGFERKRETVEDVMLRPKNQIFTQWKVPERLVTPSPQPPVVVPTSPPSPVKQLQPDVNVYTPSVAMTPAPEPMVPMSARATPCKPMSRMSREMSLPNIKFKSQTMASPRVIESRNGLQMTPTPRSAVIKPRSPVMSPRRSKTMVMDTRKNSSQLDMNRMNMALKPEAVPEAEAWMKNATDADKKVIERVLKMASNKNQLENSLRRTLLPDAKDTVEKWMKSANEDDETQMRERQVALNFFSSMAGGQLMGMGIESQRKRLKDVINTLEEARPGVPTGYQRHTNRRRKETVHDGKLSYVRLLTPNTRDNHWMHTTWHHLPEYKDDNPVGNWSSHYTRPQASIPRHFVIHPDWG